ncbi:hypothetical protein ACFV9E_33720, partial [Streptomyces sp. NPDC059835]
SDALRARGPKSAIEVQREALGVWRPFDDELLGYWLQHGEATAPVRAAADRPGPEHVPGPGPTTPRTGRGGGEARVQAAALLERYRALAEVHTQCRKHRDRKSNTGIMLQALEEAAAGRPLAPRLAG